VFIDRCVTVAVQLDFCVMKYEKVLVLLIYCHSKGIKYGKS